MARIQITNPTPHRGRKVHCLDGKTRRRCRVCGKLVYGRNGGICRDCLADRLGGNGTGKENR